MLVSIRFTDNLYTMVFFAFLIHVCAGYTFNNYFTFCLSSFPKNAGIASGLTGGVNYVIVSCLSYGIIYMFPARDEHNLGISYSVLILLSAVMMYIGFRTKKPIRNH
jgi:hypothetical protein